MSVDDGAKLCGMGVECAPVGSYTYCDRPKPCPIHGPARQCAFGALGDRLPEGFRVPHCSSMATHFVGGVGFCGLHHVVTPDRADAQDGPIDFHESQGDSAGPCEDCGTDHGDRSPCPSCGKVFCRTCAESPYAFCCDGNAPPKVEMPKSQCPRCGREEVDYDGFGILAHTKPAYVYGCGYCSHPSRDNGVCGICGDVRKST